MKRDDNEKAIGCTAAPEIQPFVVMRETGRGRFCVLPGPLQKIILDALIYAYADTPEMSNRPPPRSVIPLVDGWEVRVGGHRAAEGSQGTPNVFAYRDVVLARGSYSHRLFLLQQVPFHEIVKRERTDKHSRRR